MSETRANGAGAGDEGEPPIAFEAWAEMSARLLDVKTDDRIRLLDDRNISPDDWDRSDAHHLRALAAEIAAGHMDRANVYARACAAEIERRKSPPAPQREAAPAPEPAESRPAAAAVTEPTPPAPEEQAPASEPTIAQSPGPAAAAAPPPPVEPAPAPAPPAGPHLRESLTGTVTGYEIPLALREGAKLPFTASPPAPPQPSFMAAGAAAARPAPETAQAPSASSRITNLGGTLPVGPSTPQTGPALPFGQQAGLALQTYASIHAELAVAPERAAEILAKYRIAGDAAWRALDQEWKARLAKLPETRAAFEQLLASYKEWLLRQPR